MLQQVKLYLIAAAIIALLGCGLYVKSLQDEVTTLNTEVATYKLASESSLKAYEDSKLSCDKTLELLNTHHAEQLRLQGAQVAVGDEILALPILTLKEPSNVAPTPSQRFSDDDRLSPATMRLLDKAYCDGDKDSCASPSQ